MIIGRGQISRPNSMDINGRIWIRDKMWKFNHEKWLRRYCSYKRNETCCPFNSCIVFAKIDENTRKWLIKPHLRIWIVFIVLGATSSFLFLSSWNFREKSRGKGRAYKNLRLFKSYNRRTWMIHARECKTRGDGSRARIVWRKLSANIGTRYAVKRDTGRLP